MRLKKQIENHPPCSNILFYFILLELLFNSENKSIFVPHLKGVLIDVSFNFFFEIIRIILAEIIPMEPRTGNAV